MTEPRDREMILREEADPAEDPRHPDFKKYPKRYRGTIPGDEAIVRRLARRRLVTVPIVQEAMGDRIFPDEPVIVLVQR